MAECILCLKKNPLNSQGVCSYCLALRSEGHSDDYIRAARNIKSEQRVVGYAGKTILRTARMIQLKEAERREAEVLVDAQYNQLNEQEKLITEMDATITTKDTQISEKDEVIAQAIVKLDAGKILEAKNLLKTQVAVLAEPEKIEL